MTHKLVCKLLVFIVSAYCDLRLSSSFLAFFFSQIALILKIYLCGRHLLNGID